MLKWARAVSAVEEGEEPAYAVPVLEMGQAAEGGQPVVVASLSAAMVAAASAVATRAVVAVVAARATREVGRPEAWTTAGGDPRT